MHTHNYRLYTRLKKSALSFNRYNVWNMRKRVKKKCHRCEKYPEDTRLYIRPSPPTPRPTELGGRFMTMWSNLTRDKSWKQHLLRLEAKKNKNKVHHQHLDRDASNQPHASLMTYINNCFILKVMNCNYQTHTQSSWTCLLNLVLFILILLWIIIKGSKRIIVLSTYCCCFLFYCQLICGH